VKSKLINGLVPAGTRCPYRTACMSEALCRMGDIAGPNGFSCALARAFDTFSGSDTPDENSISVTVSVNIIVRPGHKKLVSAKQIEKLIRGSLGSVVEEFKTAEVIAYVDHRKNVS